MILDGLKSNNAIERKSLQIAPKNQIIRIVISLVVVIFSITANFPSIAAVAGLEHKFLN